MKKQVVTIAGRDFTVCKDIPLNITGISSCDIYDCYDRPSSTKVSIWNKWTEWFYNNLQSTNIGIASHNCMMFTIEAIAYVEELHDYYYFYITKTRQEISKLV